MDIYPRLVVWSDHKSTSPRRLRHHAIVRMDAIIFILEDLSRTREARRLRRSPEGRSLTGLRG
jgi:hypothetical protein